VGFIPFDRQDPHSQRLYLASDYESFDITPEMVRRSRRGYFANISYVDDKLGELVSVLKSTRMLEDTVILFCSDHGDMLGERGLWFKMCFFEASVRVPLMIAGKGITPGLVAQPTSNLDILPTLCELAGIDLSAIAPWTDGRSLLPLTRGEERGAPVPMEYAAEGSHAPMVALRDGRHKFVHCAIDPPQLFDLESDPRELDNLATRTEHAGLVAAFMDKIRARWDMAAFDAAVRESQARRWVVYPALRNGAYYPWEFQPLRQASERYMRNHMDLNVLEEEKRFPRGE
jgi:choline-sulfatase